MIIDAIKNGIVIDHIAAGKAMELYQILGLGNLDCSVAILKNVVSAKLGRKDIIKIDRNLDLDWDIIGYVDPNITVNIIKDGERVEKAPAEAAGDHHQRDPLQKPPVHHLRGAGAAPGVQAHRPGAPDLPLPVLRDPSGEVRY